MKFLFSALLFWTLLIGEGTWFNPCLPTDKFKTYQDAVESVRAGSFSFSERINTSTSSWILAAEYFSCDGQIGYLIIQTSQKEYIHAGVPLIIWQEFKNSASFGTYYNTHIKGGYKMELQPKS